MVKFRKLFTHKSTSTEVKVCRCSMCGKSLGSDNGTTFDEDEFIPSLREGFACKGYLRALRSLDTFTKPKNRPHS